MKGRYTPLRTTTSPVIPYWRPTAWNRRHLNAGTSTRQKARA